LNINADNGGGAECAGCTIAVSLVEQLSEIHNETVDSVIASACKYFPAEFASICDYFVITYGPTIIELFDQDFNSDEICHALAFCTDPTCKLWPPSGHPFPKSIPKFMALRDFTRNVREAFRSVSWGRRIWLKIYAKTKIPLAPVYGGFPVKLVTYVGKPIPYDGSLTPEQLQLKIADALRDLIRKHQKVPGNITRALVERIRNTEKHKD